MKRKFLNIFVLIVNSMRVFTFIIFLSLLIASCKKNNPVEPPPPPVQKDTITISVTGVTFRSVELRVKTATNSLSSTTELYRTRNNTDTLVAVYPITVTDTTIIDDGNGNGLALNTEYGYYAVSRDSTGKTKDSSNIVTAKTLAATSHNYTWQEYTIGESQSAIFDVWGSDDNNVFAVGTIIINNIYYGIIKWDGNQWLPEKLIGGLRAIYGFSSTDIWAVGTLVFHYDGNKWTEVNEQVLDDNIPYSCIWGTSSSDLYLGNIHGKIIHWDGEKGEVENLPTNIFITDIYGLNDNFILATGNSGVPPSAALVYNGSDWKILDGVDYNTWLLATVYVVNQSEYYIGGAEAFKHFDNHWEGIPGNIYRLRGNKTTGELVGVGPGNTLLHYNGVDWHNYQNEIGSEYAALYGVYVTNDKIFAVGITTSQAKIYIGSK
jgi:hypothetical protein